MIEILYRDEHLVAVDKPAGLALHRSRMVGASDDYLVDAAARATGQSLFLAHRLDRGTSGVILFATSSAMAAALGAQFMSRTIGKRYLAVCRGWIAEQGTIDYALDAPGRAERKAAVTHFARIATGELDVALGRYAAQRYSLLEARPESGRYHQIRRHFHHVSHHLIGDTTHGRGDHNRLFRGLGVGRLLLHAWSIELAHPATGLPLTITAPLDRPWQRVLEIFGWNDAFAAHSARPA